MRKRRRKEGKAGVLGWFQGKQGCLTGTAQVPCRVLALDAQLEHGVGAGRALVEPRARHRALRARPHQQLQHLGGNTGGKTWEWGKIGGKNGEKWRENGLEMEIVTARMGNNSGPEMGNVWGGCSKMWHQVCLDCQIPHRILKFLGS